MKNELSYFDFTREPYLADFVVTVVRQAAGNGAERFTVTVTPQHGAPAGAAASSEEFAAVAAATNFEKRALLAQAILRLLERELRDTPHEQAFSIVLPKRDGGSLSQLEDPWDYWVFAPQVNGGGEGGSGYYFVDLIFALNARRITEESKVRLRGSYARHLSGYRLEDGSRIRGDTDAWDARALYGRSIGEHWALGSVLSARANEFENLEAHVHGGYLAEANLFPYAQNAEKQLRLAYQVGTWANWYLEESVDGRFEELRPYHALSLIVDLNRPWGSVQVVGQYNAFIDEPSLFRVSAGAALAVRVLDGFSIGLEGQAALVSDLINLRKRTITDEELLLWTAQQPTSFMVEAMLAMTYTFGSVHDTIVNPRFGRVDLEED